MEVSKALPGADLIERCLLDLQQGIESIPALLVLIGAINAATLRAVERFASRG